MGNQTFMMNVIIFVRRVKREMIEMATLKSVSLRWILSESAPRIERERATHVCDHTKGMVGSGR